MAFDIRSRKLGDGSPCYIVFEAGATHSGLEYAKSLVRMTKEAGADAVKFQMVDPDRLVADKKQLFSYDVLLDRDSGKTETISEPLYDIICRRYLTPNQWRELKRYVDSLGLAFFSSVNFDEEIELLAEIGCDSIKIASADVNHFPLIKRAARTGIPIHLDTGRATLGEIEQAVDLILSEGNDKIVIHQCPSGYPARVNSIQLRMIQTLKQMFQFPIAFSDHTPGWEMDVAALALGANLLEKTITLDKTTRSVEHLFSLEEKDTADFVRVIRDVESAMGDPRRRLHPEEFSKRDSLRRGLYLKKEKKAGETVMEEDIDFRRPGYGITPPDLNKVVGKKIRTSKKAGEPLNWEDFIG
ncbi:MAG: N-acetylneuraminate synthase family protein [Bdellovibrionota bacterium]